MRRARPDPARIPPPPARSGLLGGTAWGLAAEAVALPVALVLVFLLTRHLGAAGYGAYALAAALATFVQAGLNASLSHATVRFVRTARGDERARVETSCLRLHLAIGAVAACTLFAGSDALAVLLDAPALGAHLRLFAPGLVLMAAAGAHEHVLVGRERYRERALMRLTGWVARLALLLPLLPVGIAVEGAIATHLGGWAASLALGRRYARPALLGPGASTGALARFALSMLGSGAALLAFSCLDLVALKAFGANLAETGLYVAAQNLALVPAMLLGAFIAPMVANASAAHAAGDVERLRRAARDALRLPLLLGPFVALGAGAAGPVVRLAYGEGFVDAAGPLRALLLGSVALAFVSVCSGLLAAAGRSGLIALVTVPMPVLAGIGLAWVVPGHGIDGAAALIAAVSSAAALGAIAAVRVAIGTPPPARTLVGALATSAGAFVLAGALHGRGIALALGLAGLALVALAALRASGAIDAKDVAALRTLLPGARDGRRPDSRAPRRRRHGDRRERTRDGAPDRRHAGASGIG